uniref:Arm DNA-binding domain-containing protein n=1 Tax=Phenylobacterium sp. TaxID=1871053 RepID=UPI003982FBE2
MPSVRLSKRSVDGAQAGERDLFVWDTDLRGFGLKVTPKGSKSYVVQYRMGGREAGTKPPTSPPHVTKLRIRQDTVPRGNGSRKRHRGHWRGGE